MHVEHILDMQAEYDALGQATSCLPRHPYLVEFGQRANALDVATSQALLHATLSGQHAPLLALDSEGGR